MNMKKQILQALARGYCSEKNQHKVLDPDLIESMCEEVVLSFTPSRPTRGLMNKIDTNEIRGLIRKNDNSPNLSITNVIFKKMLQLCRAYDEAQKEIARLKLIINAPWRYK